MSAETTWADSACPICHGTEVEVFPDGRLFCWGFGCTFEQEGKPMPKPVMFEMQAGGVYGAPVLEQAVRVLMDEDGEYVEVRIRDGEIEVRCGGAAGKSLVISPRYANSVYVRLADA